jgi:hypothetical protein
MATKIIWMYWQQGWEEAPDVVGRCKASWIKLNPDYEVRALDRRSMFDYISFPKGIDIERKDITVQKISALGRLALLHRYGGVWADATVMCTRPLDEWLEPYCAGRFFAFRNPGVDRLMSNWFIAAEPDSIILQRLHRGFSDFFAHNYFSNQYTALGKKLRKRLNRRWSVDVRSTLNWHSWFVRKVLRVYPYFIFHYTFNKVILTDPECAGIWSRAKPFSAEPSHRVRHLQRVPGGLEIAKREIDSGLAPMHKLDWGVDTSNAHWTAILDRLERAS